MGPYKHKHSQQQEARKITSRHRRLEYFLNIVSIFVHVFYLLKWSTHIK